jgi:phosphatidylglycerophosphate synthase
MFDRFLHPLSNRLCDRLSGRLYERGVSADQVTIAGFAIGLLALPLLWQHHYSLALGAIAVNRTCDGLDGALARRAGSTDRGAFLDIALDFFFYGAVPFGFALADPQSNALPAALLLLGFIGSGSSFLSASLFLERRGIESTAFPRKGLTYIGGLAEGGETIAVFVAMCLWPSWFPAIAYAFAAVCLVTAAMRWLWTFRRLGG